MAKINTRRLLVLARYLQKVPRRRFKMSLWGEGTVAKSYAEGCGFAGCAMGHACFIPSFKTAGLRLKLDGKGLNDNPNWTIAIKGRRLMSFDVAACLFEISRDQAEWLFSSEIPGTGKDGDDDDSRQDETPKQVARRIRKFVEDVKAGK